MKINSENYQAETLINDLKNHSIEFVLNKYGLSWKELVYIQSQKPMYKDSKATHITRTKRGNYLVNKTVDKKMVSYGEYRTRRDAEVIVGEMKKVYWNRSKLEGVKRRCGVKEFNE